MKDFSNRGLGRVAPKDDNHIKQYGVMLPTAINVEKLLRLPGWFKSWDQGAEGACVGFGTSMMNTVLKISEQGAPSKKFDPWWLWKEAKKVDGFTHTDPDDGTTVRAACDVLRAQGDLLSGQSTPNKSLGITTNRWATSVDEIRSSIALGIPVSIGVNWYSNFDTPKRVYTGKFYGGYVIGQGDLGSVRGGHCVCIYGASDKRQAVRIVNSWGASYPRVWLPYTTMQRLLDEDGEATLVTDK